MGTVLLLNGFESFLTGKQTGPSRCTVDGGSGLSIYGYSVSSSTTRTRSFLWGGGFSLIFILFQAGAPAA